MGTIFGVTVFFLVALACVAWPVWGVVVFLEDHRGRGVAILVGFVAALILGISWGVDNIDQQPSNGCKVGHYQGVKPRSFICDEYYPPPEVR